MTDKVQPSKKGLSADWFVRGALARIGDAIDRLMGRNWTPSSSLATSELIERLKRLLDAESRVIPGKGTVVPHNIKLKIQWDKFSTDADDALAKLETELLTAAADHINDSLYYTTGPLTVQVKPDYFIQGVKLYVSYDSVPSDEDEAEMNVTMPSIAVDQPGRQAVGENEQTFIARFAIKGSIKEKKLKFPPGGRLSVGRTGGNDLILDEMSVSKIHASLALLGDGKLSVADTGSTNGTFINGQRIGYGRSNRIADRDKVTFGEVEVEFEAISEAPPIAMNDDAEGPAATGDIAHNDSSVTDTSEAQIPVADTTLEIPPAPEPTAARDNAKHDDQKVPTNNE